MKIFFENLKRNFTVIFILAFRTLEKLLDKGEFKALIYIMIGLIVAWHIYTPVHELLHVAGCLMVGGTVEELALKPQYGGTLLQHIFPFIVPESEYAGQLTGFTTPNKWGYAVVDFLPFALSLFGGLLMAWCYQKKNKALFGFALILAFVPIMSLPGDFFEAASLATSEWLFYLKPELGDRFLLSDDAFKLFGDLWTQDGFTLIVSLFFGITVLLAICFIALWVVLQALLVQWVYGHDFLQLIRANGTPDKVEISTPE